MNKFKKFWQSLAGKGYYIALVLCAAAIGITGYLYYRNMDPVTSGKPDAAVNAPADPTVEAGAPAKEALPKEEQGQPFLKTGLPVSGQAVVGYAMDCLGYNATTRDWRVHDGVDIAAEAGTPVCAAAAGEVYTVYKDETMGTTVVLRHEGGYVTTYSSLAEETQVSAGDRVTLGQTIGAVGDTAALETAIGDHVHFSVRCNDEPMDPMEFLNQD
jgi:murein DD-endopeptidase MepM/ murein hydrolase activator NlpD